MSNELSVTLFSDNNEEIKITALEFLEGIESDLKSKNGEEYKLYLNCVNKFSKQYNVFFTGGLRHDLCKSIFLVDENRLAELFSKDDELAKFIINNFSSNYTEAIEKAEKYFSDVCFFCYGINSIVNKKYVNDEWLAKYALSRIKDNEPHNIVIDFGAADSDTINERDMLVSFSLHVTPNNFNYSTSALDNPVEILTSIIKHKGEGATTATYTVNLRDINRKFIENILEA